MRRQRFSLGRALGGSGGPSQNERREPLWSVLGGATRPSLRALPKVLVVAAFSALLVAGVGCGEGEGVEAGATVVAYVEAPLCAGAKRELAKDGGRAGEVRVDAVCLQSVEAGKRLDLAAVGANARRATEDSAAVGYLEPPRTPSFSRPIVEAANIAVIRTSSGKTAMAQLLQAIADADDSNPLRDQIRETLN
jgi:hypothetical protein